MFQNRILTIIHIYALISIALTTREKCIENKLVCIIFSNRLQFKKNRNTFQSIWWPKQSISFFVRCNKANQFRVECHFISIWNETYPNWLEVGTVSHLKRILLVFFYLLTDHFIVGFVYMSINFDAEDSKSIKSYIFHRIAANKNDISHL